MSCWDYVGGHVGNDSDCIPITFLNSGNILTAITSFCLPRVLKLSRVIEGKTHFSWLCSRFFRLTKALLPLLRTRRT